MRNLENFWSTFLTFETFGLKNLKKNLSDFRVNTTLWYCKKKSVFKVYALQNFFQQQCPPTVRDSCHLTNYGTQAWNQKCTAVLRSQETLSLPFTSKSKKGNRRENHVSWALVMGYWKCIPVWIWIFAPKLHMSKPYLVFCRYWNYAKIVFCQESIESFYYPALKARERA